MKRNITLACVRIGGVALLLLATSMLRGGSLHEVWLPKNDLSGQSPNDRISLFESARPLRNWRYGTGTLFRTSDEFGDKIFEAPANQYGLNPSKCPNVFGERDEVDPSECTKTGTINGKNVYSIDRSLPSGITDTYTILGNTFVASTYGIDNFNHYTLDQAHTFVADNKKLAAAHNAKVQEAEDKQKKLEAQAYNNLSFTPALPTTIPTGWKAYYKADIYGDGIPPVPRLVSVSYNSTNNDQQSIELIVGKLSDFKITATCGPTIYSGGHKLPCRLVPGTNYYEATEIGADYITHVLYEPLGDSLITISASNCCSDKPRVVPREQLAAQTAIAKSLRPVSKNVFRNATYESGAALFFASDQ